MGKPVPYDGFMQMVSIWLIVGQSGADMESAPTHEHRFYAYGRIWNPPLFYSTLIILLMLVVSQYFAAFHFFYVNNRKVSIGILCDAK